MTGVTRQIRRTNAKRIGIVGCGTYGNQILKCLTAQQRRGRITVASVADTDDDRRTRAQDAFDVVGYDDAGQMMSECDLDAVAIATPDHLHAPILDLALVHDLHVMVEKPLGVDSARASQCVEAFGKAGLLLYVDQHKRFDPAHIRLRHDIANGTLGRLQYGSVHMEDRIEVPERWLRGWVAQTSPSWFLGVNFYDLTTWLTGLEPLRVLATGQKGVLDARGIGGAWDSIQAKVDYQDGFAMHYGLSWILPPSFPSIVNQGIRIVGDGGIAEVDSQQRGYFTANHGSPTSVEANPFGAMEHDHPLFGPVTDGYVFQAIAHFIDVLDAHTAGTTAADLAGRYPDGASALTAIRLAEAVDRSLASKTIESV